MTTLVLLVTGSRFWDDVWAIRDKLEEAVADAVDVGADELIIRHGACYPRYSRELRRRPYRSADYLTHLWCQLHGPQQPLRITEQERPADWRAPCRPACGKTYKRGKLVEHRTAAGTCPAAGNYRNQAMVVEDPRPDSGLAFQRDESNGTGHCIKTMREFGIYVEEVPYTPGVHAPAAPVPNRFTT